MKYSLKHLAAAVAAAVSPMVFALDGTVVDENGQAIAAARVEILGTRKAATTDAAGRFALEDVDTAELHVVAPGYSHRLVHIESQTAGPLRIVLKPTVIEQVDVLGLPLHSSVIESSQPLAVLRGEALRKRQAATLGDSLTGQIGVHSNFHGKVASTPVIRGLSGPRVLVTQNGLDVADVSRVGPDHAVASEVSIAEQVEILRGPATLFYGSGAIGGVVNVVDGRVPQDNTTRGETTLAYSSVDQQKLASFNATSGKDALALYADGFWRESEDYEVPVAVGDAPQSFEVANSAEQSYGYTLGSSALLEQGYAGIAIGRLSREYGIPGHGHSDAEHADEGEQVYADLEQDRVQFISELELDHTFLRAINSRAAYTDYRHAEIENGTPMTVFTNATSEVRVDFLHQNFNGWKGGFVLDYKNAELKAQGEEAFSPSSDSKTWALALIEERHFGDVLIQLGARAERVSITADEVALPAVEFHGHEEAGHEEDEHEQEHEGEHGEEAGVAFAVERDFTPLSFSAGAVWDFAQGYNVGISLSYSERAPTAAELFSFGPHIGTGSYEIGALFALHDEDGEIHAELSEASIELETANNIDLTLRKHEGNFGFILNAFYNRIDNFYYQQDTNLFIEAHHHDAHREEEGGEHSEEEGGEHSDEMPVYLFVTGDVELVGYEAQALWQATDAMKLTAFTDYVRAELADTGAYLPRQSPRRYGFTVAYDWQRFNADARWTRYDTQDNVAVRETATDGYNWLEATVTYRLPIKGHELAVYLKGENLTDADARVHTSFLKDLAPRPGRNITVGLRGSF